jgi:DNA invertase Pin-like site-specific DNA recombinase
MTDTTLYLRLSDFRDDSDGFTGREKRLRAEAKRLGWAVGRVVVENDVIPAANGNGRSRPASAFKRRKVVTPSGRAEWRVYRPGFRSIVDDLAAGRTGAMLCEDLDRACRDPRDLEDLVDAVAVSGASARSLSGSLTLTSGGTDAEITMARIMVAMGNKSSRDTARRVAAKRGDLAAAGAYGGGRRPFGYRPDPDAPKYQKTLLMVAAEAAEIRRAAAAVMASGDGMVLKPLARDLRERNVPTVTGAQWTASTLRDVLLKPAVAGLATSGGTLVKASWPEILTREEWEALCAKLTDPARVTTTGNAPRHLLSGIAVCWCGSGIKASGSGKDRQAVGYVCAGRYHLRRHAAQADAWVTAHVTAYLNREDNRDLLRPPARPGADVPALRAEAARLEAIGKRQARMHALGQITDDEMKEGSRARKTRLGEIGAQLAATTEPDPLAEFRDAPDAAVVFDALPLPRQRDVVRLLATVTMLPSGRRGGRGFDPDSVRVLPRGGLNR